MDSQEYFTRQVGKLAKATNKGKAKAKAFKLQRKLARKTKQLRKGEW